MPPRRGGVQGSARVGDGMTDEEHEAEFDLVDLTALHTRMRVATRLLSDLHSPLLWKGKPGCRVMRPGRYQDIGKRLSQLTLDIIRIQDEVGAIVNEKIDEVYGGEDP